MDLKYQLNDDGELDLMDGDDVVFSIPASEDFAILYDTDGRHPGSLATILKHGPADLVLAAYQKTWNTLQRAQSTTKGELVAAIVGPALGAAGDPRSSKEVLRSMADDLEMIKIPVAEMSPAVIEEVNACLACSNRIGKFEERLEEIRSEEAGFKRGM
jgi:hypothetical protein